ncbi:MAG: 1-acyl-sn-glycerol-3-phosphate acyltransferase [Deltaproteobacteria bacterium]|nr:1-acyl-sn-glycerol-3-phosphate acyltransferase [Deltaproteobacteria bacterium]
MGERKNGAVRITRSAGRIVLFPFFCLKIEGAENIPRKSAFVLLPKHQRWEDIPLVSLASPRPLYFVAKFELFKNPISSWFLKSVGGIPLNRQRPVESRNSLNLVIELLRRGEGIVVFPEGTYYKNRMGRGHSGLVRLILSRLSPPFIPVGVNYSRRGRRALVRIRFGEAFYADSEVSASVILDLMMKEIARLSGLG